MMPFAVYERARADVVVTMRAELARSPLMGMLGAIAWHFDGRRLRIVHCRSLGTRKARA